MVVSRGFEPAEQEWLLIRNPNIILLVGICISPAYRSFTSLLGNIEPSHKVYTIVQDIGVTTVRVYPFSYNTCLLIVIFA